MTSAARIFELIEAEAPLILAEGWDNVGLMVGSPSTDVTKAALALDPTPQAISSALAMGAQLLITHHPLIFKPLSRLDLDTPLGAAIALAIKNDLVIYSAHTNLDAADRGVNQTLAALLGLKNVRVLAPYSSLKMLKLIVFIPIGHEEEIKEALKMSGAGQIGEYTGCSFACRGEGVFTPGPDAAPFIGQPGRQERAAETRLEMLVRPDRLPKVLKALKSAHPYEEPAYDLYQLDTLAGPGIGCIGDMDEPIDISLLCDIIKDKLNVTALRVAPGGPTRYQRLAVIGGSGGNFVSLAVAQGAQALLSGDLGHHAALDAAGLGLTLIEAGHFETEAPVLGALKSILEVKTVCCGLNIKFELIDQGSPWNTASQR